jgi:hypothetical protein
MEFLAIGTTIAADNAGFNLGDTRFTPDNLTLTNFTPTNFTRGQAVIPSLAQGLNQGRVRGRTKPKQGANQGLSG